MDNKIKICIAIILVLVVVICIATFSGKKETEEVNSNTVENVTNTFEEDDTETETVESSVENVAMKEMQEGDEKLETKDFSTSVYEAQSEVGTTSKKEEAVNLVKAQWGEDDTVTFSCDSVTQDGIYIIAVTSKERAVVLNYFKVNLSTKTVEVDY